MEPVIKVEAISKKYMLGTVSSGTLYRDLQSWWARFRGQDDPNKPLHLVGKNENEDFWALRDVSFEVNAGDRVGIIGRNGAGKSTLLKILSKVTTPTTGQIKLKGRVASLLEVGTGFHPELTGRENIYLNGAILGMRKAEVLRKLDEIVAFSGVEQFIDTPVKRYSSGMYVRLAFAVAAHLEPDILIVDEVLAVGDAEFQKKCLGKMEAVSKNEDRTVLFVSHKMQAIKKLCNQAYILEGGVKVFEGHVLDAVDYYINQTVESTEFTPFKIPEIEVVVQNITLNSKYKNQILPYKPLEIEIDLIAKEEVRNIGLELMISHDEVGGILFATNTKTRKDMDVVLKKGHNKFVCEIKDLAICSGKYSLGFGIDIPFVKFFYYNLSLMTFDIQEIIYKNSLISTAPNYGRLYLNHEWVVF